MTNQRKAGDGVSETKPKCPVPECGREMSKASSGNSWFCGNPDCWMSSDWTRDQLARITVTPVAKEQPVPEPKLKPCPACESGSLERRGGSYVACNGCGMTGPLGDPDGRQWNALPRRTDPPAYPDGVIVFRRTGRMGGKASDGEWVRAPDGNIWNMVGDVYELDPSTEQLELIHPAPAPQRFPWPEQLSFATRFRVFQGVLMLMIAGQWRGQSPVVVYGMGGGWPQDATYRRVTIGGADYAEREADDERA